MKFRLQCLKTYKIFILSLFLFLIFLFNPSFASASCNPASTYQLNTSSVSYASYWDYSTSKCTTASGSHANTYSNVRPTTSSDTSAIVNCGQTGAGLQYWNKGGCTTGGGTVVGYSGGACQTRTVTCTTTTTTTPPTTAKCGDGVNYCSSSGKSLAQGGASCTAYPGTSPVSDPTCTSLYCCKPNNIPNGYQTCYGPNCNTTMSPYNYGVCSGGYCNTAFGQISTEDFQSLAKSLFGVILSVAGLIAAILIIISGYKLVMSRGNPEKVQDAREQLTAAIVGLLFIIFSLVFLEFIGLDVLGLPNFIG